MRDWKDFFGNYRATVVIVVKVSGLVVGLVSLSSPSLQCRGLITG